MKNFTLLFLFVFALIHAYANEHKDVIIENNYFRYSVGADGTNLSFVDKSTRTDFLDRRTTSKIASLVINGQSLTAESVSYQRGQLEIGFGSGVGKARVKISEEPDRMVFRVVSVPDRAESFTIINIPLTLDGQPYEAFSACVLSMNLFTHVRQLPPLQTHLWAQCYARFGFEGAEFVLLGLPQEKNLPVIRDVMTNAKDIPLSREGGAWAQLNKEGYGSYLMNFGTLTEETVDEWIELCKSLGFNQIDSHGGGDFFEFGTLELNQTKWPDGWASFKRINEKLHANGISHIFHTYAFFIDKTSRYVTPVPHEDLGYAGTFTLAAPLDKAADEVVVNESTADISTVTGFHTENSVTLRIGDELIEFTGVTKTAPYKFTGLKRGANGTVPASHQVGSIGYHLSERFGRFVPGPNTKLFAEIAKKHADIVNQCAFDGIYLDAIDGSAVLGGKDDFWYYGSKFIFEMARHLKRRVGMEMSSMVHHWWHYRSRWQAWDRPVRGYKRFIDIHLASIKAPSLFLPDQIASNEWEHGIWRGHSPLIDKYAGVENGQTKLPLHLGWWGNQTWDPPQVEPTFPDDIEYLATKMIANNAGFSQLGGVDSATLAKNPLFKQAANILKQYETLRHQHYFSDSVLSRLRQPGKEFTLFKELDGGWNFKPITYRKHKVAGNGHPTASWVVANEFEKQPLKLRIEPLMSVKSYDDPSGIVLTDFSDTQQFDKAIRSTGVSASLATATERTGSGEVAGVLIGKNEGASPREGAYVNFENKYDSIVNLSGHQGLGVWVKGDGGGQLLNLSVRSPLHISHGAHGDHFIKIDFTGWKYFELVEIESSAISDYMWPDDSHFYVYDSYRHTVDFSAIESLQLWYNNLPEGKEVKTIIGPVKALPLVSTTIKNPSITVGGKKIVFPVTMESGMYLEFRSADDCKLYGSKGELIQEIHLTADIPELQTGNNEVQFSCEGPHDINPRVQVTVINEGAPLENAHNSTIK